MAAAITGFVLLLFLILQALQGILLDVYMETYVKPVTEDFTQYLWIIADGMLLIISLAYYIVMRGSAGQSAVRHEFCGIPALAMAWLVYLVLVLWPRTIWLMVASGRCLGKVDVNAATGGIASFSSSRVGVNIGSALDENFFVTIVSAGTTGLLVLLTMAQQSEHGLLRQGVALDFDIAEATFATIDAVEYWQPFFDAREDNCCRMLPNLNCSNVATNVTNTGIPDCGALTSKDRRLIEALDGPVGYMLIAVASTSFTLPFFAIWQLQKKSVMLRQSQDGGEENSAKERFYAGLEVTYMLFDLFCINVPGFALRMYIWLVLEQTITALITKNVMGIIFRLLLIYVKYLQPRMRKLLKKNTPIQPVVNSPRGSQDESRSRARRNWTKPSAAVKVTDSFMTSTQKLYPEGAMGEGAGVVKKESTHSARSRQRLRKQDVAWHSTNVDSEGPVYLAPSQKQPEETDSETVFLVSRDGFALRSRLEDEAHSSAGTLRPRSSTNARLELGESQDVPTRDLLTPVCDD